MPVPFEDRVVQFPKRFNILADGSNGTDIVVSIDGKKIALTVEPGTVVVPGTSLNAEELNKRIISDFEDVTFKQLKTLLDTLQIDKDANGNLVVKELGFRTAYNKVALGNIATSVISDATGSAIGVLLNGTWQFNGSYTVLEQVYSIISGRKYLVIGVADPGSVASIQNRINLKYSDGSDELSGDVGNTKKVVQIVTATKTMLANVKLFESTDESGLITRTYQMLIDVTDEIAGGKTEAEVIGSYENYFEGKAKTINPKLLTIGTNLTPLLFEVGTVQETTPAGNTYETLKTPGTGNRIRSIDLFTIKPDETFNINVQGNYQVGYVGFDKDMKYLGSTNSFFWGNPSAPITPPDSVYYVALLVKRDDGASMTADEMNLALPQLVMGSATPTGYQEYNTNEGSELQFTTKDSKPLEGESVSYNGITKADKIVRSNNKYYLRKEITVEGANFKANGVSSGNWSMAFAAGYFDADFLADLGFDIMPELDADGLGFNPYCRFILDGKVYLPQDSISPADGNFSIGSSGLSKDIRIHDSAYGSTATWAAFINSVTEVIFDVLIQLSDIEVTELISNGYTVIEENGTVIQVNEEGIAFETDTEIPVNVPAQIKMNTFDIRRLWTSKMEAIIIEDFGDAPLTVVKASVGSESLLTDNEDYEIYYAMIAHDSNIAKVSLMLFYKIDLTTAFINYSHGVNASGTSILVPQVAISFEKGVGFTAKNSRRLVGTTDDIADDSFVYAIYGVKAMGGDPR